MTIRWQRDDRQREVAQWAARTFGIDQASSVPQRALRMLEEAIEAAQAAGVDQAMARKLLDFVFDRPVGKLAQEIGGVGLTLLCLAEAVGHSAEALEVIEVERVKRKPIEHFRARNQAKNDAGFYALPAQPTSAATVVQCPFCGLVAAPHDPGCMGHHP